jgi:pseudaminic acid synthase
MTLAINKKIRFDYQRPPLIIAEISSNHNGSKKKFLKLIRKAYENGADMVKIQTYEPEDLTYNNSEGKFLIKKGLWKGKNLWDLYKKAHTPYEWHYDAFKLAKEKNKILFSTPFSLRSLEFLKKFKPPIYKISSFEITDHNLIKEIAKINKPIILSTGAAEMIDIESAIKIIRKFHNKIILFHCVSEYPTPIQNANINKINFLKKKFKNCMIGLSDHTTGLSSSYAATAIGVVAIEKHIKLNENSKSEDSKFSLSLSNLKKLKQISKEIFYSLESKNRTQINKTYRRSIYSATNLKKNEIITKKNIKTLRPNIGVSADKFDMIIGMKMKRNLKENQPIFKKFLKKN